MAPPSSHGGQRDRADPLPWGLDPFPPGPAAPDHPNRPYCLFLASHRPFALAVARHRAPTPRQLSAPVVVPAATGADKSACDPRVPTGVSETSTPRAVSELRIASAEAKSLRSRAAARCFSSSLIRPSTTAVNVIIAGVPDLAVSVQPQDHQHAVHIAEAARDLIRITGLESLVAFPHRAVQNSHRRRSAKIIIHRGDELFGHLGRPAATRSVARSTKLSMRPSAATDSAIAASEYSIGER